MGIAILPSQNYFQGRFRNEALTLTPLKSRRYSNPDGIQSRRRKRSPALTQSNFENRNRRDGTVTAKSPAKKMVMGQVKILKRGETLSQSKSRDNRKPTVKKENDLNLVLRSTDRLGPAPKTVQEQVRVSALKVVNEIYAGSAFVTSPPPSCLPVPCFLRRNNGSATGDLRRLLRLDAVWSRTFRINPNCGYSELTTTELLSDTIGLVIRAKYRISCFYWLWFALAPSTRGLPSLVFLFKRMAFECERNEVAAISFGISSLEFERQRLVQTPVSSSSCFFSSRERRSK